VTAIGGLALLAKFNNRLGICRLLDWYLFRISGAPAAFFLSGALTYNLFMSFKRMACPAA